MTFDPTQATLLLRRMSDGDHAAGEELLPLLYQELRGIAEACMERERDDHTLQPTALVLEAWLRLLPGEESREWNGRAHFLRLAARAMRHVLVDHARARRADKRGGGDRPIPLDGVLGAFEERSLDVIEIDDALDRREAMDGELARLVELRFFAGLTIEETANALEVSTPTIERRWRVARMWLRSELPRE